MKSYTLNRFYFEAQALVEKYQTKGYTLSCSFQIKDSQTGPKLEFSVFLEGGRNSRWIAYGNGSSPEAALSDFEKELMKFSGRTLSANDYSVELPDDNPPA